MIQPVWMTVWRILKKLGIKPPYDPAIPLLIYPKPCIPSFTAALFTIAGTWKLPSCPSTDEWIKKLCYIYIMEYYLVIKRNAFESALMRWMNLEPIIQSEVSQKEKDKLPYSNTYMESGKMVLNNLLTGLQWRITHRAWGERKRG